MAKNCVARGFALFLLPLLACVLLRAQTDSSAPLPASGQKIVFLTDSILQPGWDHPGGYVHLLQNALVDLGLTHSLIRAGNGANVSADLLPRVGKEVLNQKPDWVILNCGGNDAVRNVPLDKFKANITTMVDQIAAAHIQVMILTATVMNEDPNNGVSQKLVPYNDFLREFAKQRSIKLVDLNAEMQAAIGQARTDLHVPNPGNLLTIDGMHLNGLGQEMVAADILRALGGTDAQLAEARDLWLDLPTGMDLQPHGNVSVRQYLQLRGLAASQGTSVDDMLNRAMAKDIQAMLVGEYAVHAAKPKKKKAAAAN